MTSIIVGSVICVGLICVAIVMVRWQRAEQEVREIIRMCKQIENEKSRGGYFVFKPPPEDEKHYKRLVKRGIMVENPLEEGYTFAEGYQRLFTRKGAYDRRAEAITKKDIATVPMEEE